MCSISRAGFVVVFGLLTLAAACGSGSSESKTGDRPDALVGGGSGGHSLTGGSGGAWSGSSDLGGRSSGGAGMAGAVSMGGSSGTAGGLASGGAAGGASTGGKAGSGGRSGGGNTGGTSTGGGTSAAGNTGSGGSQTGGSGSNTNLDAGGADLGTAKDAMADSQADRPQNPDTGSTMALDSCFADLPGAVGTQMVATKQSGDNRVRIRIALDTEGFMGTSGTYGWRMIRLAVEVDGTVTCIRDRANLKYTGSVHNCTDSAKATSGSATYSLQAPDRSQAQITIEGSGAANGTWTLTDSACSMTGSMALPVGCRSGGSC